MYCRGRNVQISSNFALTNTDFKQLNYFLTHLLTNWIPSVHLLSLLFKDSARHRYCFCTKSCLQSYVNVICSINNIIFLFSLFHSCKLPISGECFQNVLQAWMEKLMYVNKLMKVYGQTWNDLGPYCQQLYWSQSNWKNTSVFYLFFFSFQFP